MNGIFKYVLSVLLVLVLGTGAAWMACRDRQEPASDADRPLIVKRNRIRAAKNTAMKRGRKDSKIAVRGRVVEKSKPQFVLEDDEEVKLNNEQRRLLTEIRRALAENDCRAVVRLVQKLQKSKEWPDGIPRPIKLAAIEALGWFGSSGVPELAGFLADGDDVVMEAAIDQYEDALSDPDLSDRERSVILVQAAKVINDAEAMDFMMFEITNMRNSVAVDTIVQIMSSGTRAAQDSLPDSIEFLTGEEGLDNASKMKEWLENHPDSADDDDFYGGSSATSDGK